MQWMVFYHDCRCHTDYDFRWIDVLLIKPCHGVGRHEYVATINETLHLCKSLAHGALGALARQYQEPLLLGGVVAKDAGEL